MAENNSSNPANNPNDPKKVLVSGKVSVEYDPKGLHDITSAIREQTAAQQDAGNTSGDISNRGIDQQKRANTIAIVALILGGVSLVATIVIILLNFRAINEAKRSTDIADSALLDNHRQFETSNRPFIEVSDIRIDSVKEGQEPIVYYSITNKGKFPALITILRNSVGVAPRQATAESIQYTADTSKNNGDTSAGIIPFSPAIIRQRIPFLHILPKYYAEAILNGAGVIYLVIEIKYTNLVSKAPYYFIEIFKTTPGPTLQVISVKYKDEPA